MSKPKRKRTSHVDLEDLAQKEQDAEMLVRAKSDVLDGSLKFEYDPNKNVMWVEYQLWDGRHAHTEMIKWDEKGAYISDSGSWRYQSDPLRADGRLVRDGGHRYR